MAGAFHGHGCSVSVFSHIFFTQRDDRPIMRAPPSNHPAPGSEAPLDGNRGWMDGWERQIKVVSTGPFSRDCWVNGSATRKSPD